MRERRNPPSVHAPLAPYSHQIELRAPERLLALSGQIGMTPDGSIPDDPAEQLDVALANVLLNLEAASMTAADLVKLTFYLVSPIDPEKRAAAISGRLEGHAPCMTLVYVAALASPAIKVEIDAWASAESASAG